MTFDDALAHHLAAIRARDLDGLAATVAADELVLVTAGGEVSTSTPHFLALHRDWFRSPTWSLDTELVHRRVGVDVATCVLRLDYRDRPPDGPPIHERSILSLVFAQRDGRWLLVQDQNTPIRT
jgi:uncharacterized protein (TIGR02246 family)